jgi:hypothetical protein
VTVFRGSGKSPRGHPPYLVPREGEETEEVRAKPSPGRCRGRTRSPLAAGAASIAQTLFFVFIVLAVIGFLISLFRRG